MSAGEGGGVLWVRSMASRGGELVKSVGSGRMTLYMVLACVWVALGVFGGISEARMLSCSR